MYGKHHSENTKALISKPGVLNSMYGKKHTDQTKKLIWLSKKRYEKGVGLYDLKVIKSFDYASDLADYLKISKVTVSKYLKG